MHLMQKWWLLCPSSFFSFLLNAKLPFFTLGLHRAPFSSNSRLFEVKYRSSGPSSTVVVLPLHELGGNFPRTFGQYFPRFDSSKMLLSSCFGTLSPHNICVCVYIYTGMELRLRVRGAVLLLTAWSGFSFQFYCLAGKGYYYYYYYV